MNWISPNIHFHFLSKLRLYTNRKSFLFPLSILIKSVALVFMTKKTTKAVQRKKKIYLEILQMHSETAKNYLFSKAQGVVNNYESRQNYVTWRAFCNI